MGFKPLHIQAALFLNGEDMERSREAITWLMMGLVAVNKGWYETYPHFPKLYDTHVLYRLENGTENWQDVPTTFDKGYGDCEDLACWRAGELQAMGIPALPYITWRKTPSGTIYHALLRWPDGKIEDPSRALGMHGHPITRAPVFIGEDP